MYPRTAVYLGRNQDPYSKHQSCKAKGSLSVLIASRECLTQHLPSLDSVYRGQAFLGFFLAWVTTFFIRFLEVDMLPEEGQQPHFVFRSSLG